MEICNISDLNQMSNLHLVKQLRKHIELVLRRTFFRSAIDIHVKEPLMRFLNALYKCSDTFVDAWIQSLTTSRLMATNAVNVDIRNGPIQLRSREFNQYGSSACRRTNRAYIILKRGVELFCSIGLIQLLVTFQDNKSKNPHTYIQYQCV